VRKPRSTPQAQTAKGQLNFPAKGNQAGTFQVANPVTTSFPGRHTRLNIERVAPKSRAKFDTTVKLRLTTPARQVRSESRNDRQERLQLPRHRNCGVEESVFAARNEYQGPRLVNGTRIAYARLTLGKTAIDHLLLVRALTLAQRSAVCTQSPRFRYRTTAKASTSIKFKQTTPLPALAAGFRSEQPAKVTNQGTSRREVEKKAIRTDRRNRKRQPTQDALCKSHHAQPRFPQTDSTSRRTPLTSLSTHKSTGRIRSPRPD